MKKIKDLFYMDQRTEIVGPKTNFGNWRQEMYPKKYSH